MESTFGKLILLDENGPEQAYDLAKANISLGRATTNDITLGDARVSRSHARLDCGTKNCTLIDLGSSNGTRLNGLRVERAILTHGDLINIGNSQLRFETSSLFDDPLLTQIDSEADLEKTINLEVLPMSINETGRSRLVVFFDGKTWEVDLEDQDQVSIGRDDTNTICIEHVKVSRRHAEVFHKGGVYILQDLESTNGTRIGERNVDQHILEDGDVIQIGPAQVIYKAGFQEAQLTLAQTFLAADFERRIVVFLPGTMGSELWLGNERVWPNVKTILSNPEIFRYPSDVPLEPRGIVEEVVIVPNLIKQDQYNRLGDYLVEELNYQRGVDYFEFAYDWRQDVRISARQLGQLVESLPANRPVVLIAHSLGTMVSRYYIECLNGKKRIERVILMGGPHQGAVKGLTSMLVAPQVLPFGIMGERLRQIVLSFPTSYQILPTYAVATDQEGKKINFLDYENWVEERYLPLLRAGKEFRKELGDSSSIPAVSIFGYGIKTISTVNVVRNRTGKIEKVDYTTEPNGDSSVLERSAVLKGTEIHPVHQYHGSLFVDNDVKMRLKLELTKP
jgi:pSer/pThr/pTyr-binding forkhead associated (FHA) protein